MQGCQSWAYFDAVLKHAYATTPVPKVTSGSIAVRSAGACR